jgi:hypothetical protein
MPWWQGPTK